MARVVQVDPRAMRRQLAWIILPVNLLGAVVVFIYFHFVDYATVEVSHVPQIEAVFGAPMDKPNHAEAAVRAALDMRARLAAWNAARQRAGRPPLRNGIGVHTGTVLAGSIGSADPSLTRSSATRSTSPRGCRALRKS